MNDVDRRPRSFGRTENAAQVYTTRETASAKGLVFRFVRVPPLMMAASPKYECARQHVVLASDKGTFHRPSRPRAGEASGAPVSFRFCSHTFLSSATFILETRADVLETVERNTRQSTVCRHQGRKGGVEEAEAWNGLHPATRWLGGNRRQLVRRCVAVPAIQYKH